MDSILRSVQVNVPFPMLREQYLDLFIARMINPEIGLDGNSLDRYELSDFSNAAQRLGERGLSVTLHAPFIDLSPGSPDRSIYAATRRRFEQVVRLVTLFKAKAVICHAGFDRRQYFSFREPWLERSIEMWSWLGPRLRQEGCRLMLENVYEDGPRDVLPVFESLAEHNVGFCLDIGHQSAFSSATLDEWLWILGEYLGQLHLHDNDGGWDDHLAMGQGTIDFSFLFQWLKRNRGSPPLITLEPHDEKDLMPSLKELKRLWPW